MADAPRSRRRVLSLLAAGALAGCTGGSDDGPSTDDAAGETTTAPGSTTDQPPETTETTPTDPRPDPGSGGDWSVPGYDRGNTGYNPDASGPGQLPERVWQSNVDGIYTMSQMAFRDGAVYTASGEQAYAVDATSGDRLWTRSVDFLGHHYPVAATGSTVFVSTRTLSGASTGGGSGALYALGPDSGTVRWRRDAPITTAPVPADETVYYGRSTRDSSALVARSTSDGTERWRQELAPTEGFVAVFGEPALADGVVYTTATVNGGPSTDSDGLVLAIDRESGQRLWERSLGAGAIAAPVVHDGTVYAAAKNGRLVALSAADGSLRWEQTVEGDVYTTPVTDGDRVVALAGGALSAVDAASGERRWRTPIGDVLINGLATTGETVYVGGNQVRAIDPTDGSVRWEFPIPGATGAFGGPIVTGETIFVGACVKQEPRDPYDDRVFALQRARGSE